MSKLGASLRCSSKLRSLRWRATPANGRPPQAKPLKGIVSGSTVLEIVERHDGNTYRVVHTIRFADAICVLHAFQKMTMTAKNKIEKRSGIVFADLGLPDAEELESKAQLAYRIAEIIRGRHLTQGTRSSFRRPTTCMTSTSRSSRGRV